MIEKDKIKEISILRALAALSVITIHITSKYEVIKVNDSLKFFLIFISQLSIFAVPCFVFISGLVLFHNYESGVIKISGFYIRRFKKILPIYIGFSLFYYLMWPLFNFLKGKSIELNLFEFIFKIFTGGAYYHLWYFGILFQFYLLFPILIFLYKKNKVITIILSIVIQLIWNLFGYKALIQLSYKTIIDFTYVPFFISHIFWFIFGFYFVENKTCLISIIKLKRNILLLCILNLLRVIPIMFNLSSYISNELVFLYSIILKFLDPILVTFTIILLYKVSLKIFGGKNYLNQFLKRVGSYSLHIYLIHVFVIIFIDKLLSILEIGIYNVSYYLISFFVTVVSSIFFAYLYNKIIVLFKTPKKYKNKKTDYIEYQV